MPHISPPWVIGAAHYANNAISGPKQMRLSATDDTQSISPEDALKLFEELESGGSGSVNSDSDKSSSDHQVNGTAGDGDDKAKSVELDGAHGAGGGQQAEAAEPDGVLTKDGAHVIPYKVLESERKRAARAEQELRDREQKLAELKERLMQIESGQMPRTGDDGNTHASINDTDDAISPEEMEAIKEDFPTLYKAIQAISKKTETIESRLNPVVEVAKAVEDERRTSVEISVQDAIDSVPKLAYMQAQMPEAFAMAKQFDGMLRDSSAWADKPLHERFAKVTEMVEQALGEIRLPGQQPSQQDEAARLVAAAAEKARKSGQVPTSLSSFPPGVPPAAIEASSEIESLSVTQLAENMLKMSPDALDEYLSKI